VASSLDRRVCSRVAAVTVVALGLLAPEAGCSQGQGEGALTGTLTVADCDLHAEAFDLQPDYFSAEPVDDILEIRLQSGSDIDIYSDGLRIFIRDVSDISQSMLGVPLAIGDEASPISATLYLNESCRAGRRDVPRVLSSTTGTIVFDAIYAQNVDSGQRAIRAQIPQIDLVDSTSPDDRFGTVTGWFSFFYQRGRPSQRYP